MGGGGSKSTNWANPSTLKDHFKRHGKDFNSISAKEYASKAQKFYKNKAKYQYKTDGNGVTRVYDSKTNSFGAYNAKGKTITFFKPTGGQRYFDRQKG